MNHKRSGNMRKCDAVVPSVFVRAHDVKLYFAMTVMFTSLNMLYNPTETVAKAVCKFTGTGPYTYSALPLSLGYGCAKAELEIDWCNYNTETTSSSWRALGNICMLVTTLDNLHHNIARRRTFRRCTRYDGSKLDKVTVGMVLAVVHTQRWLIKNWFDSKHSR